MDREMFYKSEFFDLSRVPGNGFLIFPLSMSRLHGAQSPNAIYEFLEFFEKKIEEKTVDVIFIYTNGLYFNTLNSASDIRKKTNAQMVTHKQELLNIIKKAKRFTPRACHFVAWDYFILQAEKFSDLYSTLQSLKINDPIFKSIIDIEIEDRPKTTESYDFIIEETVITYLIRQKLVPLPYTLSHPEGWRLIIYAGDCLLSDAYVHNHKILPVNKNIINLERYPSHFTSAMYSMSKKKLIEYNKVSFKKIKRKELICQS